MLFITPAICAILWALSAATHTDPLVESIRFALKHTAPWNLRVSDFISSTLTGNNIFLSIPSFYNDKPERMELRSAWDIQEVILRIPDDGSRQAAARTVYKYLRMRVGTSDNFDPAASAPVDYCMNPRENYFRPVLSWLKSIGESISEN